MKKIEKNNRILAIVHIYYLNQIDLIIDCLRNITKEYDLYVTSDIKNKKIIKEKFSGFKPDFHFIDAENVGYDIWPFIKVINKVDLSKYHYLIKLHTKRDMAGKLPCPLGNGYFVQYGDGWRECLLAFIKSKDNINKCFNALKHKKVGMCTRYNLIHGMANHCGVIDEAKRKYPDFVFGLKDFSFVAGTMFISKIEPFLLIKNMNISAEMFDKPTEDHQIQLAHVIERTIGEAVYKLGMKIVDPFTDKNYIKYINKCYNRMKYRKRLINIIGCFIPMPKIRRNFKSHLINTSFYLLKLKEIVELDSKN